MPDSNRVGKVQGLNAGGQDLEPGPVSPQPFLYSLELRAVDEPAGIPGERLWPIIVRIDAMCGRLRVGKSKLHVALLVGAAMCSACWRGSHDRWP